MIDKMSILTNLENTLPYQILKVKISACKGEGHELPRV